MALRMKVESQSNTKINQRWAAPLSLKERKTIRDNFLRDIRECLSSPLTEDPDLDSLYDLLKPGNVTVNFRRLRRSDTFPTNMGSSTVVVLPDMKRIRARRFLGCDYLAKYDHHIIDVPDEDFEEYENRMQLLSTKSGIGFKSPGGLPLVKFSGSKIFKQPYTFNFLSEYKMTQELPAEPIGGFSFEGNAVVDFKPSLWSTTMLMKAKKDGAKLLSIGVGLISSQQYVFYNERGSKLKIKYFAGGKGYHLVDGLAICNGIDPTRLIPGSLISKILIHHFQGFLVI